MTKQSEVMSAGNPATSAGAIAGSVARSLVATGTVTGDALALAAANNFFGTVAANTGARLPPGTEGDEIFVYNGGASTLTVYPPSGGTINNLSADTGLALATLKSAVYKYSTNIAVASLLSA